MFEISVENRGDPRSGCGRSLRQIRVSDRFTLHHCFKTAEELMLNPPFLRPAA